MILAASFCLYDAPGRKRECWVLHRAEEPAVAQELAERTKARRQDRTADFERRGVKRKL